MENRTKVLAVLLVAVAVCAAVAVPLISKNDSSEDAKPLYGPITAEDRSYQKYAEAESEWSGQIASLKNILTDPGSTKAEMAGSITSTYQLRDSLGYQYKWMNLAYNKSPTAMAEENTGWTNLVGTLEDSLCSTVKSALEGDTASTVGEALTLCNLEADTFLNYNSMSEEAIGLMGEINSLVAQYNEVITKVVSFDSNSKRAREVVQIYIDLVEKRNALAKLYGYENYADYAYKKDFDRGYTPDDVRDLLGSLTTRGSNIYNLSDKVYYATTRSLEHISNDEAASMAYGYIESFDPELKDLLKHMQEYDLIFTGEGTGAYTNSIQNHNAFIYTGSDYEAIDLTAALVHEFGHASNFSLASTNTTDFDVIEIQSLGLEAMYYAYAYNNGVDHADQIVSKGLCDLATNMWECSFYTEFELYAYESTDTLTVDGLIDTFVKLRDKYGIDSRDINDMAWIRIPHLFETPHYYISYSISSASAIELFDVALDDYDSAKAIYLDIVHKAKVGYTEVVGSTRLTNLFIDRDNLLESEYEKVSEAMQTFGGTSARFKRAVRSSSVASRASYARM